MQKLDIARRIHQKAGISESAAITLLDWFFEFLKATLQQGERITIFNFGVFTVRSKASRKVRNPRTGKVMVISPRRVVTFRARPHLKTEVNAIQADQHEVRTRTAQGESPRYGTI